MPDKQWHPLFVISLKEAFAGALPGEVEIIPEVALSSKPLDVDVVVVKKGETARLNHPVADIFRTYNLFEFKSPGDRLEPNDYDKGMAVLRLYKAIEHKKMLTLDSFTLTFVSNRRPRAMLRMLAMRGLPVIAGKPVQGFYQVEKEAVPVQVLVLKELPDPEKAYMFSVFFTGKEKIRLKATSLLLEKHLADPVNPYRRELLEFKFKNQLVSPEEMEVLLEMLRQMKEQERKRIEEILQTHPASRELFARYGDKCKREGKIEGKREGKIEIISRYLARRFGPGSAELQQMVLKIASLHILDSITEELFSADSLAEAHSIIQAALKKREL